MNAKRKPFGVNALLHGEQVRRAELDGRTWFVAVDVVRVLATTRNPQRYWDELKERDAQLAKLVRPVAPPAAPAAPAVGEPVQLTLVEDVDQPLTVDAVDLVGLLRVVQSIPSAKAERVKHWLATTAVERLAEERDPELAVLRTRRLYEQRGYGRRWVDKRLRGASARHELTGEWYKRGAADSDQFRALTNTIMQHGFGMDVEHYRRFKNLFKTGETLRDHMTDLELALTALGETAAVELHRDRDTRGFDGLLADAQQAGEIVAKTRSELEQRLGHPVARTGNHRDWWTPRRPRPLPARATTDAPAQPGSDATAEVNDPDRVPTEEVAPKVVA